MTEDDYGFPISRIVKTIDAIKEIIQSLYLPIFILMFLDSKFDGGRFMWYVFIGYAILTVGFSETFTRYANKRYHQEYNTYFKPKDPEAI